MNTEAQTIILSTLLICPGARAAELAAATGLSLDAVCAALVEMLEDGRVKADPNGETYRRSECPSPSKRWS